MSYAPSTRTGTNSSVSGSGAERGRVEAGVWGVVGDELGVLDACGPVGVLGVNERLAATTATIPTSTVAAAKISAMRRQPPILDPGEPEVVGGSGAVGGRRFSGDARDGGTSWSLGWRAAAAPPSARSAAAALCGASADCRTPEDWSGIGFGADFRSGGGSGSSPLGAVVEGAGG